MVLSGVEIRDGGQKDTFKAALDIQKISKGADSIISHSSIHSGLGWCMFAEFANNIKVTDNVIYDCEKYNIRFDTVNNWLVERNFLVFARKLPD